MCEECEEFYKELMAYFKEIGVIKIDGDTFKQEYSSLIRSHRYLRENALKTNEQKIKENKEHMKFIESLMKKNLEDNDYFSREKLRKMTIGELADILEENEEE